jgi:uncharacterized repeat protein (TIGR01451 family)
MTMRSKFGALLGAGLLTFAVFGLVSAGQKTEITICHRSASQSNPYITESPSIDASGAIPVLAGGHEDHTGPIWPATGPDGKWGDIIPAWSYNGYNYPGYNNTAEGLAILANGCKIPVTPGPAILSASKAVAEATASPGDTLHYTIELANTGGTDATGVAVTDDITALLAHGAFGTCDNSCVNDATSVSWSDLTVASGSTVDLHYTIVLSASGFAVGTTHLPNTVVVANTNCAANAEVTDPGCSTDTTVTVAATPPPSPSGGGAGDTTAPTQPPTDTLGSSGSGPSDSAWLLVVGLGVLLASVVVLTPARAKRRR